MTDATTIAPGAKIAGTHWTIVRIDDDGRRALVQCACGNCKSVFIAALRDGSCAPSCGCRPLTKEQVAQQHDEAKRQRAERDLKAWRPQR
jgi:hypothetical protein